MVYCGSLRPRLLPAQSLPALLADRRVPPHSARNTNIPRHIQESPASEPGGASIDRLDSRHDDGVFPIFL